MRATVRPENLLVFRPQDGWEPLCEFLGVPVPADTPYPRENGAESLRQIFKAWLYHQYYMLFCYSFWSVAILALVGYLYQRFSSIL